MVTRTRTDEELVARSVALAGELATASLSLTSPAERHRLSRLHRLLTTEGGTRMVFALADRVLRPVDSGVAAGQLQALAAGRLPGTSPVDRSLLRLAAAASHVAPSPVDLAVTARLRRDTAGLVYPAEGPALGRRLARLRRSHRRPNVNLLGEAILGDEEADRRVRALEALLDRPDVDCVSVKASAVAAGLSLVDFEGSVERAAEPLRRLYRRALRHRPAKLVNLDMEEHRDLDLTLALFTRVLSEPEFTGLSAGLALQAYLPDTHGALEALLDWARPRHQAGNAPPRVRLVKGANLAMETVDAEIHGWEPAPYPDKAATDASYKRLVEVLVDAAAEGVIQVGVASHNLFDIAFALELAGTAGVSVDIEMLAGMADAQAEAVTSRLGGLLLYVPATARPDYRNALAYLARRLDENATPEGFLRHVLDLRPGNAAWEDQARRFADSVLARHAVSRRPRQTQDRSTGAAADPGRGRVRADPTAPTAPAPWWSEPDTDLTVPANRVWATATLAAAADWRAGDRPARGQAEVDAAVARARRALPEWQSDVGARVERLELAAEVMAAQRHRSVAVMAAEAGKTFAEADPEVSEAVDYARWYAAGARWLAQLPADQADHGRPADPAITSRPLGVVVVTPPWNFPYAIPAGGVLAALAAGNTVILKPSPEAPACSELLVEQLHSAGVPEEVLGILALPDGEESADLVSRHDVDGVVLTGSVDTARRFLQWNPSRRLLAETSGKNAMVVAATADVDQAVRDLVRSAFGHAGQKCSAASLAIVEASVYDRSPFLRQLADATRSLRVGAAWEAASEVGPLVGPFTPALERALTRLDAGESWLVEPRLVDADRRLWSPGVRLGVRPGSWAHRTEWFGPVLGVMRADNLDQALEWQNAVDFGLTAGLVSLDPEEHRRWADAVEAGNLYINRTTTGAIVGRQPFGGWKGSSVGPTAKAGGPNYLIGLRHWRDREETKAEVAGDSYRHWWETEFSAEHEMAGLRAEANVLRYRPFRPGVWVRAAAGTDPVELAKAGAAARVSGTPLRVSSPVDVHVAKDGPTLAVESAAAFAERVRHSVEKGVGVLPRLRLLGGGESEVWAAAAQAGIGALDEPICSHGRIELLRWVREQSVTRSRHRYGNVVYD